MLAHTNYDHAKERSRKIALTKYCNQEKVKVVEIDRLADMMKPVKRGICIGTLLCLVASASIFGQTTPKASAAETVSVSSFTEAPKIKLKKSYHVTNLSEKAGYVRLKLKKKKKVCLSVSNVKQGIVHVQIYQLKNVYSTKLLHDMQIFAPSDIEIEKNTKKYTWDQKNAESVYIMLEPGDYYVRFEANDDAFSDTKASDGCKFKVKVV